MARQLQVLNDRRPWWGMLRGPEMSLTQLVGNGTLTQAAADVLSWGIQNGLSLFVAAGAPGAGKSTLASALLEFLPADARLYVTAGPWDALDLPPGNGPVYLLINELSWHMPLYLHGPAAQRAFALLQQGSVRMIGTVHARSVAEAVTAICDEAEVTPAALCVGMLIVVVEAGWTAERTIARRVVQLGFLTPVAGTAPQVTVLAEGTPLHVHEDAAAKLRAWVESGGA
jgi:type IV secretory pathway ATPase VirB11/archaellum biosynthesis ATPase